MTRWLSVLLLSLVALPSATTAATAAMQLSGAAPHLSGNVTARVSDTQEHFGLWEYTVRFEWELPAAGFGPIDVWLPLGNCDCRCDDNLIRFAMPSGFLSGSESVAPCNVELAGTYSCGDDVPDGRPTARFEIIENGNCAAEAVGTGVVTFYTVFAPGPEQTVDGLYTESAGMVVTGRLTGTMPFCENACVPLPVEQSTWSSIKATYR